jgi:hypothetical protein
MRRGGQEERPRCEQGAGEGEREIELNIERKRLENERLERVID